MFYCMIYIIVSIGYISVHVSLRFTLVGFGFSRSFGFGFYVGWMGFHVRFASVCPTRKVPENVAEIFIPGWVCVYSALGVMYKDRPIQIH